MPRRPSAAWWTSWPPIRPPQGYCHGLAALQQIATDRRVERQLHLIDRDAVGRHLDRLLDADPPVLVGFAHHPRDQVDVDLREVERPRKRIRPTDFRRAVRPPVGLENR